MAKKSSANNGCIILEGACTMERAADLHALLAGHFAAMTKTPTPEGGVRIDVAQLTGIDACGCQLLALFLEQLRRLGISATVEGAGAGVSESIDRLGFCSLLSGEQPQP